MSLQELVIVTGMSGSGKGTVLKAFEDLRFFCVDNLPVTLIPKFIEEIQRYGDECRQAALVIDVRAGGKLPDLERVLEKLRKSAFRLSVLFIEADDDVLLRRFSETRRPHPLDDGGQPVRELLQLERARLRRLKEMADMTIDTSGKTVHEIKKYIVQQFQRGADETAFNVILMSFGFKHGVPIEADMVLDVRFLPNPHFEANLKAFSGRSRNVKSYLRNKPETGEFVSRAANFLQYLLPNFIKERKNQATIAVGCTGGRHRSVFVAEELAAKLEGPDRKIQVLHRDIKIGPV
jgi:UPF0042 nucleotide-binding protein